MVQVDGNLVLMGLFEYLLDLVLGNEEEVVNTQQDKTVETDIQSETPITTGCRTERKKRLQTRLKGQNSDPGVTYLNDPYFADYDLKDFSRIVTFREEFFNQRPEVSAEHGKLLTDFFIQHGYETKLNGDAWDPNLRKAESFKYLMTHKTPVIRKNDLIAGSYTENPIFGAVGQPYAYGPFYWGELRSFHQRELQPYTITKETIETLHKHVFPFWAKRNIQELWKQKFK